MDQASRKSGHKTLIVGLGKTGLSCARFLTKRGYSVALTDSREHPPCLDELRTTLPNAAVFVGGFSEKALVNTNQVVVSPGVPLTDPFIVKAKSKGLPVIGDIELFALARNTPVVAITGSNGKSTVVSLVTFMAQQAGVQARSGGNIGTPALDLLARNDSDWFVLELSSFQLDTTSNLQAEIAVVLNVSPDHLDRYPDVHAYAESKSRIYLGCETAIVNRDDGFVASMVEGARRISFGLSAPERDNEFGVITDNDGNRWLAAGRDKLLPVSKLRIYGEHNLSNALAALAVGSAMGLLGQAMLDALTEFRGLPHRLEWVADTGGVTWLNDSKGTNPGATVAAVTGLHGPLVLIAGGDAKGADFTVLAEALPGKVKALVLIGKDAGRIAGAAADRVPVYFEESLTTAVRRSHELAEQGDTVLLSPACSSLDMFADFEARGRAFIQAVRELRA